MQSEKVIKILKLLIVLDLIFILSACSYWAYDNVIEPAYVSTVDACGIRDAGEMGYIVAATYRPSNNSIVIKTPDYIDDESYKLTNEYKISLKHELCHRNQANENRLSGCGLNKFGFPGARMVDEIECYFRSYF